MKHSSFLDDTMTYDNLDLADVGQLVRAGDVVPKRQFFPIGVPVHRDALVNLEIKYKFLNSESCGIEIVHLFNAKYWNVPLQLNQLKKNQFLHRHQRL